VGIILKIQKFKMIKVNIGCGRNQIKGWHNFDNSFSLKLAKMPWLVNLLKFFGFLEKWQTDYIEWIRKNNIKFADARKKLSFKDNSVDVIYTSHMLEHLHPNCAKKFLLEAKRVLRKKGILRICVPDLRKNIDEYLKNNNAEEFMRNLYVCPEEYTSFTSKLKFLLIGIRHHQWMYDKNSLSKLLLNYGFKEIFILKPGETLIKDSDNLDLYERKKESFYIEAIK
jgi:predicted SAM-dependent methyltransferase